MSLANSPKKKREILIQPSAYDTLILKEDDKARYQ